MDQRRKREGYVRRDLKLRTKSSRLRFILFAMVLLIFFIIGQLLWLRPKTSEIEKRELTKFPRLTASGIWDGSFYKDVQTWFADTYPLREKMISAQASLEEKYGVRGAAIYGNLGGAAPGTAAPEEPATASAAEEEPVQRVSPEATATPTETPAAADGSEADAQAESTAEESGETGEETQTEETGTPEEEEALPDGTIQNIPEEIGTVYVADHSAFEIYYFSQDNIDAYTSMLGEVRSKVAAETTIYDVPVPTAYGACLSEKTQKKLGSATEKGAFDEVFASLDPQIKQVDAYSSIVRHNAEYIYFRTDHHWTARGAYYAYCALMEAKGVTPLSLDDYQTATYEGFLGTFYSASNQSPELGETPDEVETFRPVATNTETVTAKDGTTFEREIVSEADSLGSGDKYMCFIGGDNPFTEITNPNLSDGSSCVLVKESYGNAFAPFLVDHYQHVYIVDYRYYTGNLTEFINSNHIQDLIFLNNSKAITMSKSEMMANCFR